MSEGDQLRVGNVDREQVVERLNLAFADGQLDVNELDERVRAAYGAKTRGELRPLTADLPDLPALREPVAPATPRAPAARHAATSPVDSARSSIEKARAAYRAMVTLWAAVVGLNVLIWACVSLGTRDAVYFWPIWVAGPWGAVLLAQYFAWYRPGRS